MNKLMNPEIKGKWLIALKSGEYQKGRLALRDRSIVPGKIVWCCLGVLCDLYNKETGKGNWTNGTSERDRFTSSDGNEIRGDFPTKDVLEWAGLGNISGSFTPIGGEYSGQCAVSLAGLNDSSNDFNEVIGAIEKYF